MLEGWADVLLYVGNGIGDALRSITKDDIIAITLAVIGGEVGRVLRDRIEGLVRRYVNRLMRAGLRRAGAWHAIALACVAFVAVYLLIMVPTLPYIIRLAIAIAGLTATVVFTWLGWRARGPRWFKEPALPLRRFAIFYEPTAAAVTPFVLGKLPEILAQMYPVMSRLAAFSPV
jgi:hypothetical protein